MVTDGMDGTVHITAGDIHTVIGDTAADTGTGTGMVIMPAPGITITTVRIITATLSITDHVIKSHQPTLHPDQEAWVH